MSCVLCYGDSNTHGTMPAAVLGERRRHPRGQRWPDVLAAALGPQHEVIAEGLPGRTTVHEDAVEGGARSGVAVLSTEAGMKALFGSVSPEHKKEHAFKHFQKYFAPNGGGV